MKKVKRFLAVILVASLLLGSNGVSYAAEALGAGTESTEEAVQEMAAEESSEVSVETYADSEAEPASEDSGEQISDEQTVTSEETADAVEEDADTASDEAASAEETAKESSNEEATNEDLTNEEASDREATEAASAEETVEKTSADGKTDAAAEATTVAATEEVFKSGELSYKGRGYTVTLSYDESAKIPEGAQLKVREITKGSAEYERYLQGAQSATDKGVAEARFFDITIWADGKEIQPQSAVRVNISYNDAIEVADEGEVQAMHFENGTSDPEVLSTDTNGGGEVSEIAFDAESFSVYGVIYTVDFTYGGYTFSMPGEGSILLSDLAEKLGLYEKDLDKAFSVSNVSDVTFTDYELLKIEKQADGDWLLISLAPFSSEETLTITMNDGVKFVIGVTDEQVSSNLVDFLTNAVITGATQDSEGRYEVEAGKEYNIILSFAESSAHQFDNRATLTYTMPDGLTILSRQTGELKVNIVYKGRTYQVDATYDLGTDGNLEIKFDENDPDFHHLENSTNVSFRFSYNGAFDGSEENIHFSEDIERDIVFEEPEPGQAYVSKSGTFDEETGKFTYTITVEATGDITNVNVKDVISGNALIFNNDVQVSGNSSSYRDNGAANGFDYTFASMREGEVITITYSASVDFSKDTDKDGKISVDQTKNTATVKPDGGEPHTSEYSHEIAFKTTKKSNGENTGTTADGDKIYKWTITYNELMLASAGGDTIKDTIAAGSTEYMKYYGDGLSIKVTDKNGNVEERTVPYSSLQSYSDSSWTYKIPESDTQPYKYEITYYTVVDMEKVEGTGNTVTVTNDANGTSGSADVTPESVISVTKSVDSFTTEEVNWSVTLGVPENGLTQAVVTDTFPSIWLNGRNIYDLLKDGSLQITGLLDGESYTVENVGQGQVKITFYQDRGRSITGLKATPGGHTITVKLTTLVDQEWLQAGYESGGYVQTHTNNVAFNGKTAAASVIFGEPGIEKKGEALKDSQGNVTGLKYTVLLVGVSETPVSVLDTFDTSVLEVDTSKASSWDHMRIWGGNQWSQDAGRMPVSYTDTGDGIILTADSVPMQTDGTYYPYYRIVYYLKVKDGVDLQALAIANGGEYDVDNTVKWGDHESEFSYKVEYDYLDKQLLNEGELGGTNRTAKYQITFNPSKATLNEGSDMTMTDVLSANLSVDYSSINIVTDPAGQSVVYSLSGGEGGTTVATYTIPDSTKVTITYDANVRGNGSQTIVNKVSVNGKEETVENIKSYGSASEGEGAQASFKIVKVDGYDANIKLQGVKFKVFCENPDVDFGGGQKELILVTDENGEITLDGEAYTFYFDEVYHVQEIEAPEDYGTISFDYLVTLTNDMQKVDYGHYIYYYSDSMQIKNWPLEGLVVEKQVESSDPADYEAYYHFIISVLNDDGSVNTDFNEKSGDDQFENGVAEFWLKAGEQKMFWGFDKGTKYKVEEIDAEGFVTTVTYSVYDEDGNVTEVKTEKTTEHSGELTQDDETIVFKNTKTDLGALKIKKNVTVNGESTTGTEADGTYTFTITGPGAEGTVSKTVTIIVTDGVAASATVDGEAVELDSDKYVEVAELEAGEYTITESAPTNDTYLVGENGKKVTVVAGESGEDVSAKAEFTNNKPGTPEFEKKIQDTNDTTGETSGWQDSADYDIGDAVPYKLTAMLPNDVSTNSSYSIQFEDRMENSLTFAGVSKVTLNDDDITDECTITPASGGQSFTVSKSWSGDDVKTLDGATVEVYFTATLNNNAKIGSQGNVNAARLHYDNKSEITPESGKTTDWDYVIAFTYKLDVNKVDQDGEELTGAEFKLEKVLQGGAKKEITLSNEGNVFKGTGLDDGDYVLTETKAPTGYKPIEPIEFTVTAEHGITWDYTSTGDDPVFEGGGRATILTALTGETDSGDLEFAKQQSVEGLVGTVANEALGSLKLKKLVTVNGKTATGTEADGTYEFTITGPGAEGTVSKTVTITVEGGVAKSATVDGESVELDSDKYVEVANLDEGEYTITETAPTNDTYLVGENGKKVTVVAGESGEDVSAKAEFTNNKPGTPEFDKKIQDTNDSTGKTSDWQDSADYDIGDSVPYKLTATLPNDVSTNESYSIEFEDKMENTLTFEGVSKVTLNGDDITDECTITPASGGQSFTVSKSWTGEAVTDALNGATVEVYFTATLNNNAKIGSEGNVNAARLHYDNKPSVTEESGKKTPWDYVIAFTYKLDVNKVDQDGQALEGAEFKLEKVLNDGTKKVIDLTKDGNVFTGKGLDDGDYVLTETKAPTGYKPIDPIEFTVTAEHGITWDYTSTGDNPVFEGGGRATILTALTGETDSGDLVFAAPQSVEGLTGTVKNQKLGSLKVKKNVLVNGEPTTGTSADGTYTFVIKDESGKQQAIATITIVNGVSDVAQVDDLPVGKYIVSEDVTKNPTGMALVGQNDVEVVVAADQTAGIPIAVFTNDKTEVGSMKIKKNVTVNGEATTKSIADGTYTFNVKDKNGVTKATETITIKDGESDEVQIDNLPTGKYTVSEDTSLNPEGMSIVGENDIEVEVTADATTELPTAEFTNNIDVGSLKIKKNVTVNGAATTGIEADGDYSFVVKDATGTTVATKTITIRNGESNEIQVDDLVPGTYTVSEVTDSNPDGMVLITDNDVQIVVTAGETAEVKTAEFTNNKPGTPEFEKKIQDTNDTTGQTSDWQDSADYDIGDSVPYKLTATLPNDVSTNESYSIKFEDTMESTLTFEGVSKVTLNGDDITDECTITPASGGQSFTVSKSWSGDAVKTLDGAKVEVYFTATLNDSASIGSEGNVNAARLHYDNKSEITPESGKTTDWDYVIAFTYKLDVNKVDQDGEPLEGAEFKLEKKLADGTTQEIELSIEGNVFTGKGLDDGDYVLTETTAPTGYKPIDPIEFTVTAEHGITWDYTSTGDDPVFEGGGRATILKALTGETDSGDLKFAEQQSKDGLTGTVTNQGIGALKIEKVVTGTAATDKSFTFEIALTAPEGTELDSSYPATLDGEETDDAAVAGGKVTVTLTAGQVYEITGLPAGTTYTVTETDLPDGYTEGTHTGTKGTIEVGETAQAVMNNTYETAGEVTFNGTKTLEGRDLKKDEFTFELYESGKETPIQTVTNNADGSYAFETIEYSGEDLDTDQETGAFVETVKTYTIKEKTGTDTSITYDDTEYEITVTLNDNGDGTITAVKDPDPEGGYAFTNTYEATGSVTFGGVKTMEGQKLEADAYTFELYERGQTDPIQTVTNEANGDFSFETITYTLEDLNKNADGEYIPTEKYYTVKEVKGESKGVTYDETVYEITVTISDDGTGSGKLTVETDKVPGACNFKNTYETKGEITFSGTKTLKNKALEEGMFTFELYDSEGTLIEDVTNAADGSYSFTTIKYTGADLDVGDDGNYVETTKTYTVVEKAEGKAGITYDGTKYEITVTLKDDGKGTIEVSADPKENTYDFTNTYETKGEITFSGTKTLKNRALEEGEFSFELYDLNGDEEQLVETVTNKADGSYSFTTIEYTGSDLATDADGNYVETTKTYKVVEKTGDDSSVTYDTTEYEITVTLKDDGEGTIETSATPDAGSYDFTNTYKTKGEITFSGKKTLENKTLEEGMFTFELYDSEGTLIEEVTNAADGSYSFTKIGYTGSDLDTDDAGNYVETTKTYKVVEKAGDAAGIDYDDTEYEITVTLTDDGAGTIKAVADPKEDTYDFTNTYETKGKTVIGGVKVLEGRELKDGEFTFELKDENGDVVKTAANDADGNFSFEELTFTGEDLDTDADGSYIETTKTYTVAEKAGSDTTITYDGSEYTVELTLTDDGNGNIEVVKNPEDAAAQTFKNTYEAKGEVTFGGKKTLEGRALTEGEFSFELKDAEGNVLEKVTNDADGNYSFTTIKYTLADLDKDGGKYIPTEKVYTVSEVSGEDENVEYDDKVYTITCVLTDKGDNTIEVTTDEVPGACDFTNTYNTKGEITFSGKKTLENRALFAGEFAFELYDSEGTQIDLVFNEDDGSYSFSKIEYTGEDLDKDDDGNFIETTKTYKVVEKAGDDSSVTYDDTEYEITVTLKDDGEGTIETSADPKEDTYDFTNTYETEGEITFSGEKKLENRKLTEGEFSFELYDEDGTLLETVTNAADGSYSFTTIKYTGDDLDKDSAGNYLETIKNYRVVEKAGEDGSVTYDDTEYEITVTLTDNGKGTIEVTADPAEDSYDFTNTYNTKGEITFSGEKTLENRALTEGEFSFELYDSEGTLLETATNKADGSYSFTTIEYTGDDLDKDADGYYVETTKTYKVVEKAGEDSSVTYDDTEYEITVTLTDDGEGTIAVTADPAEDSYDFTNTYSAKGSYVFEAEKILKGRPLTFGQFSFELYEEGNDTPIQTAESDNDGSVTFEAIEYTQDDMDKEDSGDLKDTVKTYTLKEVTKDDKGYTYSEAVYKINVTLHDDKAGTIETSADKEKIDLTFTNIYEAEGEIVLNAQKKLLGERALEEGQFTFELKDANGKVIDSKTNAADGSVTFDAIKYTQDDIYEVDPETGVYSGADTKTLTYTISEVIPEGATDNGDGTFYYKGYTYDGTVYTVDVVLTDNGDGTITAVVAGSEGETGTTEAGTEGGTTEGGEEAAATDYVFTNAYDAAGTLKLDAEKIFKNGTLKGGEFTFELKDAEGNVLQSKKNDAAGNVSFELIAYSMKDLAKSPITYTVNEVVGSDTDVKYDEKVYTVTVTLADNGDGTLSVTKKIDNGGALKFVNEQMNVETSITIGGVKVLKGQNLKAGQFKFVMVDENGKKIDEVTNDADGNFTFDSITYKLSDLGGEKKKVFTYGISEVKGSDRRIIYDEKVHTVVVTVTDNGDGTMTATADKSREDIRFVNTTRDKTGDEAPLGVLFGGLGIGAIGLAVLLEDRRRRNRNNR